MACRRLSRRPEAFLRKFEPTVSVPLIGTTQMMAI
jgi:hypothetical protein